MQLEGKTTVVTGANSGMGRATVDQTVCENSKGKIQNCSMDICVTRDGRTLLIVALEEKGILTMTPPFAIDPTDEDYVKTDNLLGMEEDEFLELCNRHLR